MTISTPSTWLTGCACVLVTLITGLHDYGTSTCEPMKGETKDTGPFKLVEKCIPAPTAILTGSRGGISPLALIFYLGLIRRCLNKRARDPPRTSILDLCLAGEGVKTGTARHWTPFYTGCSSSYTSRGFVLTQEISGVSMAARALRRPSTRKLGAKFPDYYHCKLIKIPFGSFPAWKNYGWMAAMKL
ncbi:hypothetical protein C8R44DRAFT_724944 [Mycena epipterygia]|nr:hypothetical protein C8R44DRAFT_724944 [Mycena epipterygia]